MLKKRSVALAGAGLACWATAVQAQNSNGILESVVVVGQRVQPEALAEPITVIHAQELSRRQSPTIGETLRGLPGVSATGFGANSSRPVIRGQDGDRVKLLQNSSPVTDASAMSFDHAVGLSPYALDQVEILRGPAALLYGGSAVGGVVNLVDRRILRSRVDGAQLSIDLRGDTAHANRQAAVELESDLGANLYMHLDVYRSKNGDQRAPKFTDSGEEPVRGTRVRNTAAETDGLGLGVSKVEADGYWGLSWETHQSDYGVPKEIDTEIRLDKNRLGFGLERTLSGSLIEKVRIRAGVSDYRHKEIEAEQLSSVFENRAHDARIEFSHGSLGSLKGVMGVQWEHADFDVKSQEEDPLQPQTQARKVGVFLLEELVVRSGTLRIGARLERAQVRAARTFTVSTFGDEDTKGQIDTQGGAQTKTYSPFSVSAQYSLPIRSATTLSVSASHVQRAPSSFERFTLGVHHASGLFEAGNPRLSLERGHHYELTMAHKQGQHRLKASLFSSRYANYITLIKREGVEFFHEHHEDEIEGVPVYDYAGVGAKFYGLELEYTADYSVSGWRVSPGLLYDHVIGRRTSNHADLPRLTPQRLTLSIDGARGPWRMRGEMMVVGRARLGENEVNRAPAYSTVNLALEHRQGGTTWFLKGTNLTDKLAYNANTVDEVRRFTPISGRSLQAGVRIYF